jgi:ubiquinone/menaquinone biosynthesis C-methylase UbiE
MNTEDEVGKHYGRGGLQRALLEEIEKLGKDRDALTPSDLAPMDEFHLGGLGATEELAAQMELRAGCRLLDVGCGIGGPARWIVAEHGCHVTGVDLTIEFVQVARTLTNMLKLDHLAQFEQASALQLPFSAAPFDGAYMMHVGMNIEDKAGVFREVKRIVKPGGLFVVFDVMRKREGRYFSQCHGR